MQNKTIVIHPQLKRGKNAPDATIYSRSQESRLEEAKGLARAAELYIDQAQVVQLQSIVPGTYLGKGKVEEIGAYIKHNDIMLAIINAEISPVQQRNLETAWDCKVIDRTGLILEIFGQRANSKEGRLQVELASQEYQKSRLVKSWTHLERQRGGAGFMGGPGETQIEVDRRAIRDRIAIIKKQLATVVRARDEHRKSRQKIQYKVVALVGYTNAGKSTLFNRITGAEVLAMDKLFATLDPTMRLVKLPSGNKIILSDTVGFISDLPTNLVAAFRATLEEVVEADLILHVRDIANPETEEQKKDVLGVLSMLGLEHKAANDTIEVLNKVDLLLKYQAEDAANAPEGEELPPSQFDIHDASKLYISAITGQGIYAMLAAVDMAVSKDEIQVDIEIDVTEGQKLAWLYEHAHVLGKEQKDEKLIVNVSFSEMNLGLFRKLFE